MSASQGDMIDHRLDAETVREFGGPWGVVLIMLGSHGVLYYLWISWRYFGAAPTWHALGIYSGFLVLQALFAAFLPGVKIKGLPIPSQNNARLEYRCNGIWAWYITLILLLMLNFTGWFPLSQIVDDFGPLMTVAMLSGDIVALFIYWSAKATKNTHRMSGNFFYDYFMGAWLNPRLGAVDLKMWAEIRIAWILLFILTLSAAFYQYKTYG